MARRRILLPLAERLDEPVFAVPDIEAEAELIAARRREPKRRGIVLVADIVEIARAADAEEAFVHKALRRCAETFRNDDAAFRIALAFQRICTVVAVVVRRDGEGRAPVFGGEHRVPARDGIAARPGTDHDRISAVGKPFRRPDVARAPDGFVLHGAADEDDAKIVRRARERGCDRQHNGKIARDPLERGFDRIALLLRRERVGVHAVLFNAVDDGAVHFESLHPVIPFGRERHRHPIAEDDVGRDLDAPARHFRAAVERDVDGKVDSGRPHRDAAVAEGGDVLRAAVVLLGEVDRHDLLFDGETDGARRRKVDPLGIAAAHIDRDISFAVDGEHEVYALLLLEIFDRLRVAFKVVLRALAFEHEIVAPLCKAETELLPGGFVRDKVHRVGEVDQLVVICALEPEESAEHKAVRDRTDLTVDLEIVAGDVLAALQRKGVLLKDDLFLFLCREEHKVVKSPVCKVVDRNVVQSRREPGKGENAVPVRHALDRRIAARKGDLCVCKNILPAFAVNGRDERLFARIKRLEHRFHRDVARDLILRDPDIRLLRAAFRPGAKRGIHIIVDVIVRDRRAVDAELFERIPLVRLGDKDDGAVLGRRVVAHPLLHRAVLRRFDGDAVPLVAAPVEMVPALRIRPGAVVEAGADHIILTVGLPRTRIVVGGDDARRNDEIAAFLHALRGAFAADFVKISPREEEFKGELRPVGVFIGARAVARQPDIGHIGRVFGAVRGHPDIALRLGDAQRAVRVDREAADRFIARHRERGRDADVQLHAAVAVRPAGRIDITDFSRLFLERIGDVNALFAVIGPHFDLRRLFRLRADDVVIVVDALTVAGVVRTQDGAFQPADVLICSLIQHAVDGEALVGSGELPVRAPVFYRVFGRLFASAVRLARRKSGRRSREHERKTE